ncbi:hypothetical protein FA15DRAFT_630848 [Coprinopsis marcescibilis]|uniref:Uncharacterized protein n=1 Tax=Coprinopsis marcescibilis TaxID=230819 RepID=A0A5C3LAD9_COPMA|nr:hypothetical protein FA15DRAFT_630848 [Coprinopsis marcescibilis]
MFLSCMAYNKPDIGGNSSRHVNHLLHTLRGEQFRHAQNVRKSKSHLSPSSTIARNKPTLPVDLATLDYNLFDRSSKTPEESQQSTLPQCSGPLPPKSWTLTMNKDEVFATASWRSQALSLIYDNLGVSVNNSRLLPLSMMCLLHLISRYPLTELREDILPFIPQHLCQSLVRYTSIHSPLPTGRLLALYEEESHANGEIIIVGPNNALREDYFIRGSSLSRHAEAGSPNEDIPPEEESWDSEDKSPTLLRTVIVISSRLSMATLLSFPPTITHLALVRIPAPISLHRLPKTCPLLVFLDLSYNDWLSSPSIETLRSWDRIDWSRWRELKDLGLRGSNMPKNMLDKVNQGRWEDVDIIQ